MSLSTKITLVTTMIVTIVMSIVLTGIYLLVKQTAINTQIKDISSIPHLFNSNTYWNPPRQFSNMADDHDTSTGKS